MNVICELVRRACMVAAAAALVGQAGARAQTYLIDFGSDTSYRGLSVHNPDDNGNYWNSVQPGLLAPLIDTANNATDLKLGWDTPVGTDSYNGPAGATSEETLEFDVMNAVIDAQALGNLGGALEAAFDFATGYNGIDHFAVRFQIQGLNPNALYDLTFFGSHAFSNDATTVYKVFSDDSYATEVASTTLDVQDPAQFFVPNRDRIATITGVAPQEDNILYIEFVGANGFGGYLNDMQLVATVPTLAGDFDGDGDVDGADFLKWQREPGVGNLADWKANFGDGGLAPVGSAVPEPAGLTLLAIGGIASTLRRKSHLAVAEQ